MLALKALLCMESSGVDRVGLKRRAEDHLHPHGLDEP
jgi:hypothetical protein